MRYVAPSREDVAPAVFEQQPLAAWSEYAGLLSGSDWPSIEALNALLPDDAPERFVVQSPALLADGLHYEQRIAMRGEIATREANWHDLFNALIWLRYPALKRALNARQIAEVARMGPKLRSRPQYAQTHFDEAGVVVTLRDPTLLPLWDAHDWYGLFWRRREAWRNGSIELALFGHALLEHALTPSKLLVGKALVFVAIAGEDPQRVLDLCAEAITDWRMLRDPLDLRPLPLAGIPGWHANNDDEAFHRETACYQPLREGRRYPPPGLIDA
ncbi:DUF3025 domain-containing protein [Dyella tabacisoli]|uniref:DUF3025 domain-containing protein n=1 Tax=Dyella tabacisoli TaxID=2282381 RepID=A0A369UYM5_9GAMM|nr:DUF3025 domain-containing protein [Dyella tabacisoli]RDD83439.1 DUF3025 domain-containing protein [Dyella tabacisoli]